MPKHNNEIPNNHFKKCAVWQSLIKTWFEQPARNKRRRLARAAKAKAVFPRPTAGPLRPVVHSSSIRYNMKTRAGRGFSLDELKEAGIPVKLAPTIGVAVDWRRKNKCLESLQENANRLKAYKAKLILFPRKKTAKVIIRAVPAGKTGTICWEGRGMPGRRRGSARAVPECVRVRREGMQFGLQQGRGCAGSFP